MKKRKTAKCVYLIILAAVIGLNAAAWGSTAFCDWYIANVFPLWVNTLGRLTGLFAFSVGEWMILAGVLVVVLAIAAALTAAAVFGFSLLCRKPFPKRLGKLLGGYGRLFAWTLLAVCLIMTLNCSLLYHASTFSEKYFGQAKEEDSVGELLAVYNLVAENCNRLAQEVERDEAGNALYTGKDGQLREASEREWQAAMADEARELMRQLGQEYGQLDGWYPRPKAMRFSDFMCQQYMQGYYFPFSMEANYNDVMCPLNIPATMCHELAHLRGYIYEDEANLIGYLACIGSENPFIEYSGYLSVLPYLNNDVYKAWQENEEAFAEAAKEQPLVQVAEQVWQDDIFVTDEEWERINGKALIDTELVDQASDVFVETTLKANGVADGKVSYSRVVRLLLQYYRDK